MDLNFKNNSLKEIKYNKQIIEIIKKDYNSNFEQTEKNIQYCKDNLTRIKNNLIELLNILKDYNNNIKNGKINQNKI